jgi:circadian clock protein KaiC
VEAEAMNIRNPVLIPGIDEILKGGLVSGRSYLLAGSAGTGKTIFGLQWLISRPQDCSSLYITLTEPTGDVSSNVAEFGWNLQNIKVADLTASPEGAGEPAQEYQIFPPSDVENVPHWQSIYQVLDEHKPRFLVLDSLTQLRHVATDDFHFRKNVLLLVKHLNSLNCTSILLYDPLEMEKDCSVDLAVDGIFRLRVDISKARVVALRYFQVEKLRGSDFLSGLHPMRISNQGVQVYPHRIEQTGRSTPAKLKLTCGIPELDQLLGGGLESGTTTLFSGPSGVGKSSLATSFARHALISGRGRAVYYSFEESLDSVDLRAEGLGQGIRDLTSSGGLKFDHINAMELYPDEFLQRVRRDVLEDRRNVVILDSIRGYQIAMEEFGSAQAHIYNLITFLNQNEVMTILTNVSETVTGPLRFSELGISHIADNILVLRYAEHQGRVIKVLGCLKKRLGHFESELRELILRPGPNGIVVGPALTGMRGILTGVPSQEPA